MYFQGRIPTELYIQLQALHTEHGQNCTLSQQTSSHSVPEAGNHHGVRQVRRSAARAQSPSRSLHQSPAWPRWSTGPSRLQHCSFLLLPPNAWEARRSPYPFTRHPPCQSTAPLKQESYITYLCTAGTSPWVQHTKSNHLNKR